MEFSVGVPPNSSPTQIPQAPHSPPMPFYARAPPSTAEAAQQLPGDLTLRDGQKPNHFFAAMFPTASRNSPAILFKHKEVIVSPPQEPMTATDNQSVTHDGMCPTQVGFVPGTVQSSGRLQVWPRSVTSPTPAGAGPCALTQMLIALLQPTVKAQTKAPPSSPQAMQRPGPRLLRR